MSQLETAMALLMKTFDTYACGEGKKDTLTKAEAKVMLEKELPQLLQVTKDKPEMLDVLSGLDLNGDSEMDFSEFVVLVAGLTCMAHDRCMKKK